MQRIVYIGDEKIGQHCGVSCGGPGQALIGFICPLYTRRKRGVYKRTASQGKLCALERAIVIHLNECDFSGVVFDGEHIRTHAAGIASGYRLEIAVWIHDESERVCQLITLGGKGFCHGVGFAGNQPSAKLAREVSRCQALNGIHCCAAAVFGKLARDAEIGVFQSCLVNLVSILVHLIQGQLDGCICKGQGRSAG